MVSEGTNSFPAEDFSFVLCCNFSFLQSFCLAFVFALKINNLLQIGKIKKISPSLSQGGKIVMTTSLPIVPSVPGPEYFDAG